MSNTKQQVSYGFAHKGVGVTGLALPKEVYEPSKHNRPSPMRPGSMDAFSKPSLDHTGNRRPYWASEKK